MISLNSMIVLFFVLICTLYAGGTEEEFFDKQKREDLLLHNLEPGKVTDQRAEDCDKETCQKKICNCCPGYGVQQGGIFTNDMCKKCECGQTFSCSFGSFTKSKTCLCDTGYTDDSGKCKADCKKNPCKNAGKCTVKNNEVICVCTMAYTGKLCDKKNPCLLNTCKNGGTCVPRGDKAKCQCPENFKGNFCEKADPYVPENLRNTSVSNTSVTLRWDTSKSPTIYISSYRVHWKNSTVERDEFTMSNATFHTVKWLWPYVEYSFKVAAVTRVGQEPWTEEIIVRTAVGVPYPPENLNITSVTNTSIGLIWDRPTLSTGPILKYRVYWMNAIDTFEEDTLSNHTFYTVRNLRPYDVYMFKVLAVTEAGHGQLSKERQVWTDIGIPHAPRDVTLTKISNTSADFKWSEPSINTGPIVGYRIHWKNYSSEGEEDTKSQTTFYTLQNLTPYVVYTFKVLALTAAGTGEWSEQVIYRTKVGVPYAPRDVKVTKITSTSADLKWNEPAIITGPIVGYRIHWQSLSSVGEEDTKSQTTFYTVQNLTPYTVYIFRVSALTAAGSGEWSKQVIAGTKIGDKCSFMKCQNGGTCSIRNGKTICNCKGKFGGDFCEIELVTEVITKPPEDTTKIRSSTIRTTTDLFTVNDDFTTTETYENMTNETLITTESFGNMTSDYTRNDYTTEAVNFTSPTTLVKETTPTTGTTTTTTFADCKENPCKNEGTCTVENDEVICVCKKPFTGKLCDEDPYAPENLTNTFVSNTSVALQWEKPKSSAGNIWSYRIQWKNSTVERYKFTRSNATFHTVTELWPYVEYTFKVAAVTAFSPGPWSEECIVWTEVGVPFPPENLNTTFVTNTSIGLTWDRPTLSTGPILKYRIYWRNANDTFEEDTLSNHTLYIVRNLRPYDEYALKVLAVTEAGHGQWSKEQHVWTDIGIPNAPINLQETSVTNTSVSLKWDEPPVTTGPLLFYRIVWRNGKSGGSEDTPTNKTFHTVKYLSPYVLYKFSVLAVTKAGAGEASEEIDLQTDIGVPHAPLNLKLTSFTNTSVNLKWEEPPVSTGPIFLYRIYWRYSNRVEWEDTPSNDTFYTVKRLRPFVLYTFTVSAVTAAGIGASSEEVLIQTNIGELTTEVITKPSDYTSDTNTTDAVNFTSTTTPGPITTTTNGLNWAEILVIACIIVVLTLFSSYMVYRYKIKN